jgi:Peptidase A4 family
MTSGLRKRRRKFPFELRPTSIKNVYSFVPPPRDLDPTRASTRTLIKHGLFFRPPDPEKEPKLFVLWKEFVSEIWTDVNFIVPTFEPTTVTHNLQGLEPTETNGVFVSKNWSGCVVVGSWVGIFGVWQVPTVSQPATPPGPDGWWHSSSWVGLNGGGGGILPGTSSHDVLQAGVTQDVSPTGASWYYAWYEWSLADDQANQAAQAEFPYVFATRITSVLVNPGDYISVVVQFVQQYGDAIGSPMPPPGPYHFGGILLTNVTTGKAVNLWLAPPTGASFAGDTAEWIMECPSGPNGGTLPQFSNVTFANAGACAVPDSYAGVELQNGVVSVFRDSYGNVETSEYADTGTVTINYL